MKSSQTEVIEIGNRTLSVRHWGEEDASVIFMLHGWLDCSATFQFVVDALRKPWHIIAPDWRGHGGSHRTGESYLLLQYIADLDAILEHYSPGEPVQIVGHSMGANMSCLYAGARPERVRQLVSMEGLGPVPGLSAGASVEGLSSWLARLRRGVSNRPYRSLETVAARLRQANPRLTAARAEFLACEFTRQQPDGSFEFDVDPYQHALAPIIGIEQLVESAWPNIMASVLLMTAAQSHIFAALSSVPDLFAHRLGLLKCVEHVHLQNAGHNLHHDCPQEIAGHIERFLS